MTRIRAFGSDTFRSLRVRNFRLFFVGQIISQTGTWMQMIAIGLLVLALTDSGVAVGLVTAAQFLPILVLGAWGGVLADRRDRHHLLIVMNAAGAVVALAFAVLVLTGSEELWSVYLLTFAAGTVVALENPARRALVTDLVAEPDVPNAVGLNSTMMTTSRVIGPALGGALIAGPGIGWCFAANAISYVPQLWLFLRLDRSRFRPTTLVEKAKGQLREGLRYVWGQPELRLPLLLVTAVGTMAFNFSVIFPLFATRDLDGSATTFTTMMSIMSLGSVIGALSIARRTKADTAFLARCTLALGVSMAALALAPGTLTAYVAVVPVGMTSIMVISGSNAVVQLATAPAMRGRVLALLAVVFLGSTPIGGPITGWISETVGARWAIALGAVTALAAGLLTFRALHGSKGAQAQHLDTARIESIPLVAPGR
ncbi:MAG: MFS transporter [Acidimicrobiales bacterium]